MTTARDAALKAAEWADKADKAATTAADHRKSADYFGSLQNNHRHAAEHRADAERADAWQQRAIASATMWAAVASALHATETNGVPQRGTRLCHDTDPTTLKECALRWGHTGSHADANVRWEQAR